MENSFETTHLKIGTKNYVFANTLLLLTSTNQRPSKKSKLQLRRRNKSKVGCKEQELDRRTLSYFVALEINLDLLEEKREQAAIHEAKSKEKMEKYYNSKVRSTSFKLGDLMYLNNEVSRAEDTRKLGPKWEGPYEVTEALGKGAYKVRDHDIN
ncbi:hypothetical protein Tco_0630561 [Tanacetum coccineum]